jgi:hypothetical protein
MSESVTAKKNFYLHLWFDAPHGPWETIEPYDNWYVGKKWGSPGSTAQDRNAK